MSEFWQNFEKRNPILAPALAATFDFSKRQLLMNLVLAALAIPVSWYYGLLPDLQLMATIKAVAIVYAALLLAAAIYNFGSSPIKLISKHHQEIALLNERLDNLLLDISSRPNLLAAPNASPALLETSNDQEAKPNLVFKRILHLDAYMEYGVLREGRIEGYSPEPDLTAITLRIENEFSREFKVGPVSWVTAQVFYHFRNGEEFYVNRGAWLDGANHASFGVNDTKDLIIAIEVRDRNRGSSAAVIHKEYDEYDAKPLSVLASIIDEDCNLVRVKLISENLGVIYAEKAFDLKITQDPFAVELTRQV